MENQSSIGVQKVLIQNLSPAITNAVIIGIIIGKQRPKKFIDSKDSTKEKGVWNFTIRDSPVDYINVTCWGSGKEIVELNDTYHVGDVVTVINPRIDIRKSGDHREQYYPMVTSPFMLTLNQPNIAKYNANDCDLFNLLLHIPTKPMASFVSLADVHNSGGNLQYLIDLLGAVRTVGSVRHITTKANKNQQVRDIVIFDHTYPALKITLWDPDLIARASFWKPRHTILFMTDMKTDWSNFNRSVIASLTLRTIVTEDPIGQEAEKLRNYARTAPLEPNAILDHLICAIPNPFSIQNVMSIQQVLDKIQTISDTRSGRPEDNQFTALLYVLVTSFDLDGLSRITSTRCACCKTAVRDGLCLNDYCLTKTDNEPLNVEVSFDFRIVVTDQTGSLDNCRLSGHIAESILNCTVGEFLNMTDDMKNELKWKYLMERCAVRIMVLCMNSRNPRISILDCRLASPTEAANKIPHY